MKVAQFLGNCFFLSGIFFRQFQALPPGCPAYLVPYATSSLIVHTIWVGRFRFDCTVSLTVVCGQRKEGAVMVFILSKIKCFFRLLQSAALHFRRHCMLRRYPWSASVHSVMWCSSSSAHFCHVSAFLTGLSFAVCQPFFCHCASQWLFMVLKMCPHPVYTVAQHVFVRMAKAFCMSRSASSFSVVLSAYSIPPRVTGLPVDEMYSTSHAPAARLVDGPLKDVSM